MGKSRLGPIKPITIPRMELSAAVVSTKLDKMVRNELSLPISESFFWTDSTCVLRYIGNTNKRFQTFVANRIATIHDVSSPTQWNYVDTHTNPADDASRGVPSNSLQRWIEGPDFLNKTPDEWPKRPEELILITEDNDPEVKKSSLVYATDAPNAHGKHLVVETIERFSSWCRVKRVFAWILRYRRNLRLRAQSRKQYQTDPRTLSQIPPISLTELVNAETEILKYIQQASFKDELSRLRRTETNDKISNTSCIINFVKGEREFRQEVDNWNQEQINDFLVQRNIKWTFNPPAASHHGGVWERCIRTVRKVMRAIMKEQLLDDEGLNTLMCEVEAIVNRRPLTKLSDNP